ncbi:hypothetical protein [Microbacterium sp. J1-1]|uniref:hypothetical protein n=1 Tax=Microbacterium sp. J1-1 TaxID=2992441 RepID=UPI002114C9CB|nr:hypothetical protein [Microbacterium sp. J1-1]UUE19354.1 hypothetical protein LRQ07_11085 [Microbacterium sp. J1-1]
MDEITAAWIGVGGASAVGLVGWVLAGVSNGRAKKANKIAEGANQLAADALREARESNQIAQNANKLSEEANSIAHAQSLKQSDPSHVEWEAKWDKEASIAQVTNRGRDDALDTTILFKRGKVEELVRGADRISRGDHVAISFPEIPEQRTQHAREEEAIRVDPRYRGIIGVGLPFGGTMTFDVRWISEFGNPGQQTVKLYVS